MTKKRTEFDDILKLMREKDHFLITSHKDPDGDSIGSQLSLYHALRNTGKKAYIVNQGAMPEKYLFLDPDRVVQFSRDPVPFTPEVVFVLECPILERIGFVADLIPASAILINIDHHLDNAGYGAINVVDKGSCAVGEMIFDLLTQGEYELTKDMARSLYAAMICDTGNFRFASTTARGMKVAAQLIEKGADPKSIYDMIFLKSSLATLKLLGNVLASLKLAADGRISYMAATCESARRSGARIEDSEGFVDYTLSVDGARLGMLFKEVSENEVKVSVRTQNGIDAAGFARIFNGGGHMNAAGFTLYGKIPDIVEDVLAKATEFINAN
jgi:bifunctional oligoribonuclease and PAP phosphatase NrnA